MTRCTYDDNGQTVSESSAGGAVTYGWNREGRLDTATTASETLTYTCDADGIRTSKTANATTTAFVVDKNRDYAQVLEERNGAGTLTRAYIHGDDLISQEFPTGDASLNHADGQLSTRQLTDGAAQVTDEYTYDAFGVVLAQSRSASNSFPYTGM